MGRRRKDRFQGFNCVPEECRGMYGSGEYPERPDHR